jgi:exodeoxyribonuclease VII large subunit
MLLEVRGNPRLHPQFGFSVTVQSVRPVGEGSIKKAVKLLEAKLRSEGLFDEDRKRKLLYPPQTVGLITSKESAGYSDFMKILNSRWRGLDIQHLDVQVQGSMAIGQIVSAIEQFNQAAIPLDVLVIIRGGGSTDDLQVFNTEQVARAVSVSRIPTMVAIGHESDISLAELVADKRASTPSNAAELLVPDRRATIKYYAQQKQNIIVNIENLIQVKREVNIVKKGIMKQAISDMISRFRYYCERNKQLVGALNPETILKRGYAIIRNQTGQVIREGKSLSVSDIVNVQLLDANLKAQVQQVNLKD